MRKFKVILVLLLTVILFIGCVNTKEAESNQEISKTEYTYKITNIDTIDDSYVRKWYENNFETYGSYVYDVNENLKFLLISAGERRTNGHSLEIDDVKLENTNLIFSISLNEPKKDKMLSEKLTHPALLVKVEKNNAVQLETILNFEKQEDSSKAIMDEYGTRKFENIKTLKLFVDSNIKKVEEKDANQLISDLIARIKIELLPKFNEYLFSRNEKNANVQIQEVVEGNQSEFNNHWRILSEDKKVLLNKIEDEKLKEDLAVYFNRYLGLSNQEGSYYAVIDYYELQNDYGEYLSETFNVYNNFMKEQIEKPITVEEYLNISLDELVNRISKYELFIKNNGDFEFVEEIKKFYMIGIYKLVNPSPFDNSLTNNYKPTQELMDAYDKLNNNNQLEVTKIAVNDILEFIDSKSNRVLGSYQNHDELSQIANEIYQKISKLIDDEYIK